ncbi:hypothetical protein PHMEG_00026803, partial [Phytophthora megakarya]
MSLRKNATELPLIYSPCGLKSQPAPVTRAAADVPAVEPSSGSDRPQVGASRKRRSVQDPGDASPPPRSKPRHESPRSNDLPSELDLSGDQDDASVGADSPGRHGALRCLRPSGRDGVGQSPSGPSLSRLRRGDARSDLADHLRDADSGSDDSVMHALSGRPTSSPPPASSDLAGTARDRLIELDVDDADDSTVGAIRGGNICDPVAADANSAPKLVSRNELLTPAAYAQLPPTCVDRVHWLPGYRARVIFSVADAAPWPLLDVSQISVLELDVAMLFSRFSKPPNWLFPKPEPVPDDSDWDAALLDEGNVSAVYVSTPWGVLAKPVIPISFERDSPPFQTLSRKIEELQTRHRQAAWESTHSFPISEPQRRSRFGAAWKSFLKFVLLSIVAGHCDLDILLDPVFLHFPRPGERSKWHPDLHCILRPANLFQALRDADPQDPWRNQYRHAIEDHPGSQFPRLEG